MNSTGYHPPSEGPQHAPIGGSGYAPPQHMPSAPAGAPPHHTGPGSAPGTPYHGGGYAYQQYPPHHNQQDSHPQPYQHPPHNQQYHDVPSQPRRQRQEQHQQQQHQPYQYRPPQPQSHPPPRPYLPPPSSQPPQHHQQPPPIHTQSLSHPPHSAQRHTQPSLSNASRDESSYDNTTSPNRDGASQPTLASLSRVDEAAGRKYRLDVMQQPRRARMCGFGDKDRRPITPPPCVRLIITDMTTGKEFDCNDLDHAMFVLNVDLWDAKGENEVNLVRSSQGAPSISATSPFSYGSLNGGDANGASYSHQVVQSGRDQHYGQPPAMAFGQDYQPVPPGYASVSTAYSPNGNYGPPAQYYQNQGYRPDPSMSPLPAYANMVPYGSRNGSMSSYGQDHSSQGRVSVFGTAPTGMFSRNLIGSLAASAFRLVDTEDRVGIWFVLQDLSVRTEGSFRLRFSFVNVGPPGGPPRDENAPKVNTGRAPILASAFSDVFTVYSAKKFPGVCESTPLSKKFATQGIKIPIRKDGNMKGDGDDDEY